MSISQQLQSLKKTQNQAFDTQHLIGKLKRLSKLSLAQINANRTIIQDGLKQAIPIISKVVLDNYKMIPNGWHDPLKSQLLSFAKWNPMSSLTPQIKAAINSVQKSKLQVQQIKQKNLIQNRQLQKEVKRVVNEQQDILVDLKQSNPYVLAPRQFSGIQQQVQPIKKFLQVGIPTPLSSGQIIPKSIKFLQQYTKLQGYQGIGTITDKAGRTYIGRHTVKQGNQVYVFPYPQNKILNGQSPNITQNFKYYANKAVNKWNGFVQAQNQLVGFVRQVQTKQKRKQFVEKKLKGLTKATFAAMALSSLTYYYIQIPIEIFAKFNLNSYDGSMSSFKKLYKVGSTLSKNPFLFTDAQGLKMFQFLMKEQKPIVLLQLISAYLNSNTNPVNNNRIKQFSKFLANKGYQAINYFTSAGIPQDTYLKKMQTQLIDENLKLKKFILPSPFQNTQILQILSKVNIQNQQKQGNKVWKIQWGGQYIPCHDYVWNYQIQ